MVWIHNYHLMLLPNMLRKQKVTCRIGYFCHTPFPSSELFRALPMREKLLKGVLGTFYYYCCRNSTDSLFFLHSRKLSWIPNLPLLSPFSLFVHTRPFFGCDSSRGSTTSPPPNANNSPYLYIQVRYNSRSTVVGVYPVGTEPSHILKNYAAIREKAEKIRRMFPDTKLIVGRDRLDNLMGIPEKLKAVSIHSNISSNWDS